MPFDGVVTRAVVSNLNDKIISGRISKIHQPTDTELIITVRSQRKNQSLLISIHPVYTRMHLTEETYQNPSHPSDFVMLLRKHLSGAIIDSITQYKMERIVTISVQSRNEIGDMTNKKLIIELMGKHSNVMLIDGEKEHILDSFKHVPVSQNSYRTILPGQTYKLPPTHNKLNPMEINGDTFVQKLDFNSGKLPNQILGLLMGVSPLLAQDIAYKAKLGSIETYKQVFLDVQHELSNNLYNPAIYRNGKEDFHVLSIFHLGKPSEVFNDPNTLLDRFYAGKAERDRVKQQAKDLYQLIKNEKDKNYRKLKKHEKTLQKAENAATYQRLGELLTANMHQVKTGDDSIEVINYYDPEQKTMTIELDPTKTPSENAQNFFKTYQKLKTSKEKVQKEISRTKKEISYLDQLLQQIDTARMADIEEMRDELKEEGYIKKQKQSKQKNKPKKPKPENFAASDGTSIFVGKNNKQNDHLTTKLANRDDIWLHTKDIPGSHVLIRTDEPSEETLKEAAQLAAYFSKSYQSSSVPVDYTRVRHVWKPNGSKPGFVTYKNQKTIYVTPESEIVDKLKNGADIKQ